MPKTRVEIKWDKPEKQYWLNKYNIDLALSAYCPNTKFEVEEIERDINSWLECHMEAKISMVNQSVSGYTTIISIWYYDEPKEDPRD